MAVTLTGHPALQARRLARANALARWRAQPGQAALQVVAMGLGGALVALLLWRGLSANAVLLSSLVSKLWWALTLAWGVASWRAALARTLAWRAECERGPWAALPLAGRAHRRAGDWRLVQFALGEVMVWWALAAALVAAGGAMGWVGAVAPVLGIAAGAVAGRVVGWRRRLDVGAATAARVHHAHRTVVAKRVHALPHVAAWQRAAGIDAGVSRRIAVGFGLLLMSVPGSETLRTGALLVVCFVLMMATQGALAGALRVIAPLAALLRATPVPAARLVGALSRWPTAMLPIGAVLSGVAAAATGAPLVVALGLSLVIALHGGLRLAAALRFRHEPARATTRVVVSTVLALAMAQIAAPLGVLWVLGDALVLATQARRVR